MDSRISIFLLLAGLIGVSVALECYTCEYTGLIEGGLGTCWDDYDNIEAHIETCNETLGEVSCFKMKFKTNTNFIDVYYARRGCGNDTAAGDVAGTEICDKGTTINDARSDWVEVHYWGCQCGTDKCNGEEKAMASLLTLTLVALLRFL